MLIWNSKDLFSNLFLIIYIPLSSLAISSICDFIYHICIVSPQIPIWHRPPRFCWNEPNNHLGHHKQNISSLPSMVLTHYSLFQGMALLSKVIQMQNFHHYLDILSSSSSLISIHSKFLPVDNFFFYYIPFPSSPWLLCYYKMLSFPPSTLSDSLNYSLRLSITSSLSNPFSSPTSGAISSKTVNLVVVTYLQLLNSPSWLLWQKPNSLLWSSSSEPSVHSFTLCLLDTFGFSLSHVGLLFS